MTPVLRKTHRYVWYTLAFLLPLGWLAAIRAIPDAIWQQPVRMEQPAPLPVVLQSRQSGDFLINLRQDSSGAQQQVEIFIQKPLANPNTTATLIGTAAGAETLLGLLGTRGVRRFNLDSMTARNTPLQLQLKDKIQGRLLSRITFE